MNYHPTARWPLFLDRGSWLGEGRWIRFVRPCSVILRQRGMIYFGAVYRAHDRTHSTGENR